MFIPQKSELATNMNKAKRGLGGRFSQAQASGYRVKMFNNTKTGSALSPTQAQVWVLSMQIGLQARTATPKFDARPIIASCWTMRLAAPLQEQRCIVQLLCFIRGIGNKKHHCERGMCDSGIQPLLHTAGASLVQAPLAPYHNRQPLPVLTLISLSRRFLGMGAVVPKLL